ncbi:helicase-associated domain-containing protein [Nocardioides sambongensis]|uniref:helicase-associated domain-containing protein n=1 Tax=Nocardioides sambongensis TaxID=2589074 RepID=UPI001126E2AC|nr:helicase-associated domain-containing protein [Nocardioides sambongensis]
MDEGSGRHRSLADQLRSWPDERLRRLLTERVDLATPAPHDFSQLASRAAVRNSILRALDSLTRGQLSVLDALVVAGQTTTDELIPMVSASPEYVAATLEELQQRALIWNSPEGLRPLTGVADCLGSDPAAGVSGLRPRSARPRPVEEIVAAVADLSAEATALLDHVIEAGGLARAGTTRVGLPPADARTPAEELTSRRLLQSGGSAHPDMLVVPGEVGLARRGGRTTMEPVDVAPTIAAEPRPARLVASAAVGAATEFVRRTEQLLQGWGEVPAAALRTSGLGVRELRSAAQRLGVDPKEAALLAEVASAAGLLGSRADADGNPVWVPTDEFDAWCGRETAERWTVLARAWVASPRLPLLVGERGPDQKPWNALTPELSAVGMPEAKAMVLAELADLPDGTGPAAGTGLPSLVARLGWRRPRRPRTRVDLVGWAVEEAAHLGLTGAGVLTDYGRALARGEDPTPLLAGVVPRPVDHVLVQADLTAVAPGPLEPDLARRLQQIADLESHGAGGVYRFTPGSIRRGLDAGWSGGEIKAFLAECSRTPVPQPLDYLVDDAVRGFGRLRVGLATAYLTSEDEVALAELVNHPRAAHLELRRIAATVVISTLPVDVLLPRMRELGFAPVVEGADGVVRVGASEQLRARRPREAGARGSARAAAQAAAQVEVALRALREGEAEARRRPASASTAGGAASALRDAIERRGRVEIGFTDRQGVIAERVVAPLRVEGGELSARDVDASPDDPDAIRSYPLHRISRVTPL